MLEPGHKLHHMVTLGNIINVFTHLVQHREPRVGGVGERAGRQDVPVAHPDPRDLWKEKKI